MHVADVRLQRRIACAALHDVLRRVVREVVELVLVKHGRSFGAVQLLHVLKEGALEALRSADKEGPAMLSIDR